MRRRLELAGGFLPQDVSLVDGAEVDEVGRVGVIACELTHDRLLLDLHVEFDLRANDDLMTSATSEPRFDDVGDKRMTI